MCSSPDIIRIIKSKMIRFVEPAVLVGEWKAHAK
jgi:hypothetical protein